LRPGPPNPWMPKNLLERSNPSSGRNTRHQSQDICLFCLFKAGGPETIDDHSRRRRIPMHEVTSEHWHEPEGRKNAGYGAWKRPNTPYDDYMEAQGIPIYRGIGVRRVQDMPLKRWNRMGGNGTFIQLYGTEGKWGC